MLKKQGERIADLIEKKKGERDFQPGIVLFRYDLGHASSMPGNGASWRLWKNES